MIKLVHSSGPISSGVIAGISLFSTIAPASLTKGKTRLTTIIYNQSSTSIMGVNSDTTSFLAFSNS